MSDTDSWIINAKSWEIKDGKFFLEGDDSGKVTSAMSSTVFDGDVEISVQVEHIEGIEFNGYGSRFKDNGTTGYAFVISNTGSYLIGRWDGIGENIPVILVTWRPSSSIEIDSVNTLRIRTTGDFFEFFINGIFVHSLTDDTHTSGTIGLVVNGEQTVSFDNLTVKISETQPLLKAAK